MSRDVHVRIDNRLLHGQVVQFWLGYLDIAHLIVANDDVAKNNAMSTIYRLALPETVTLTVIPVQELADTLDASKPLSTMVLLRDVIDTSEILNCRIPIPRITIGNIHDAPGRKRITDSVYLSAEEMTSLSALRDHNIRVEIQTFPGEILRLGTDKKGGLRWSRP
ncbi:MAG: PTS sugar transporter subunit IIB [Myxococcota bacterium]|nr:PTS sugar transporter subunit IIB [Myxococcota bacterium]